MARVGGGAAAESMRRHMFQTVSCCVEVTCCNRRLRPASPGPHTFSTLAFVVLSGQRSNIRHPCVEKQRSATGVKNREWDSIWFGTRGTQIRPLTKRAYLLLNCPKIMRIDVPWNDQQSNTGTYFVTAVQIERKKSYQSRQRPCVWQKTEQYIYKILRKNRQS